MQAAVGTASNSPMTPNSIDNDEPEDHHDGMHRHRSPQREGPTRLSIDSRSASA